MLDKVVVITGASGGIGAALAPIVAERGASVVLAARREKELREVARACGERAHSIVADVTRRDDVRRVVSEALARFGRIDVLVYNVALDLARALVLTDEDIDGIIRTNVKSALYESRKSPFKARGEGHVINISSVLGRIPLAVMRSAYTGAKHFLNALTASLREEVQQTHPGIQFSLVSPGVVHTDFGLNARHGGVDSRTLPNAQTPAEAAAVIASVIETRRPDVYTRAGTRERVASYYASVGEDA
jgi:NAD(P)-dependent dehydrogenase (short-subunit alcohol dehydrogenase family)